MVEPQHKRVKKLPGGGRGGGVWLPGGRLAVRELQDLHQQLCSKCLCSMQLENILDTLNTSNLYFSSCHPQQIAQGAEGSLLYASLLTLFFEVALKQRNRGVVCTRISEVVMAGADNEGDIISILLNFLSQDNKYTSYSAMRALVPLLLLLQGQLSEHVLCRLTEIMRHSNNWLLVGHAFEVVKRIIEWKDIEEHPLESSDASEQPPGCHVIRLSPTDVYGSDEVKYIATKALGHVWHILVTRSSLFLDVHTHQNEHVIVSFLSLWTALISVKNNLNVDDTKEFFSGLERLVNPLLSHSTALVVWEKILDLFNEVLCYGSTLALQEVLADEPCNLAHLLIRALNTRHLLEFVPCGQPAEDSPQSHTDHHHPAADLSSQHHAALRQQTYSSDHQMQACSSSQQNENISERQPSHSADQQQVHYDLINQQSHECSRVQRTKCMQENLLENFKNVNCTVTNPNCVELKDPNTDTSTEQVKNQISYLYIDNYKSAANNCDNVHEKNVNVARTTNGGPVNCIQTSSSHIYSIAMKDTTKDVNLDSLQNLHNIQSQDESVNCSKRHKTSNGCNSCCGTKVSQYCTALQLTHHYQSAHSSQHIATSKLASFSSASQPHLRNSSLDTPIRNSLTLEKGDNEDAGPEFPLTPPSESIADSGDEYDLQEVINKVDMPLMVAQTFRGSDGSTNPYLGKDRTNSPTKFDFSSSVYNKIDSSTNTIDNTCTSASCSSSYAPSANIKNNLNSGDSLRNESMNDIECSSHSNSDNVIASNNLQQSLDGLQMLQDCYGECGDSDGEGSGSVHSDDKRRKLSHSVDNLQQEQLVQSNTLLRTNSLNNFMLNSCSGNSIPSNANNLMINTGVSVQNRPYDTSSKNVNTIIRTNSNAVMCNAISADDLRVDDSSPMCVNSNSDLISHCNLIKFDGRGTISYQESGAKKVQTNIITCSSRTQSVHNHSSLSTNEHLLGSCSVNKGTDDCVVSFSGKTIAATRCKSSIGNLEAPIQTTKDVKHNALLSNSGSAVPSSSADNERSQQCIEEPRMSCSSSAGECNTQNSSSDAAAVPGNSERHLRVVVFRKTVLLLLKAIAVTVKEARGDGESSSSSSESSSPRSGAGGSETEQMDMEIIGRSLKEALQKIDSFVKGREAYHPHCPMAEWLVKLFSCQDDWMVEAMVCGLDIYSVLGNSVRGVSVHLGAWLCPHTSFLTFLDTVRYDSSVMVALLVSNETCFLLYLLRYLKVAKRSWLSLDQVSSFTNSNVNTRLAVEAMQQLRDSINSLVANGEFPYNISPVLQLLDHCHQLFAATLS